MAEVLVFPVPYIGGAAALDHKGRAHALVAHPSAPHARFVGATRNHAKSDRERKHVYDYDLETPTRIFTPDGAEPHGDPLEWAFFKRQLEDGALVCADEQSAERAGMAYTDPQAFIEAWKARAIAEWHGQHAHPPACAIVEKDEEPSDVEKKARAAEETAKRALEKKAFKTPPMPPAPKADAKPASKTEPNTDQKPAAPAATTPASPATPPAPQPPPAAIAAK